MRAMRRGRRPGFVTSYVRRVIRVTQLTYPRERVDAGGHLSGVAACTYETKL